MASSGTFTSGRYGAGSYGPWLTLAWTQVSQSVANNTTTLDLTLRFHWSANINYTFRSRTGSVQGNSYTYSGSVSGTSGSIVLKTQRVTITHNSNGARSVSLSGNIANLGINWSGSNIGTMSVSGTANLNTIPRASTLSAFSFASHLKPSTEVNLNYTIDRKSTTFRHHIQLRDGSHVVQEWDSVDSNGASSVKLSATSVNNLLNRMSSVTSRSLTLRITTWSGTNSIGSAVSRNATATVHADVKPTVSVLSVSQTYNNVSDHFLQSISRVKASFTPTAVGGATIVSNSILVRKKTANTDGQTINSSNGSTSRAVALSGVYQAQGLTRDSRGRQAVTYWAEFTVTPYSSPRIDKFGAVRSGSSQTTVDIKRSTTHTPLGGKNVLTWKVQRRLGTGAWTNVTTNPSGTNTTGSIVDATSTSTGNSVASSYEFKMTITDSFGETAESIVTVSTQRVVLDIHKNHGVGIGKIHEQGVLDVDGGAHFKGDLFVNNVNMTHAQNFSDVSSSFTVEDTSAFWYSLPQGTYYVSSGQIPNQPATYGFMVHSKRPTSYDFNTIWYEQATGQVYRKSGNYSGNHGWTVMNQPVYGSNEHGTWTKYWDGTMIQTARRERQVSFSSTFNGMHRSESVRIPFPQQFVGTPLAVTSMERGNAGNILFSPVYGPSATESPQIQVFADSSASKTIYVTCLAIGRWK